MKLVRNRKLSKSFFGVLVTLICVASVCFTSCAQHGKPGKYDPSEVNFQPSYIDVLDNIVYPSLILGLGHYGGDDQTSLFSVQVTSPERGAVLRIVIDSSLLNYVTILQETMPDKGETYTFYPKLKWKYDKLYALRQQGSVDLTFTCFINDEEVDVKTLFLNYRSVNESILSVRSNGKNYDLRWLFAAYVNEDHPYIDQILSSLLQEGVVARFSGYQPGKVTVKDQVFAIWYYALSHGISYSSISCTSNPSNNANVQHIRFFDEVYNTRQANCIDACVFFASILRKIGLKPVIFVEPCHAFLGYYTDKNRKNISLLETTITSWVNFPELDRSLTPDGTLPAESFDKVKRFLSETQLKQYEEGKMDFKDLKMNVARSLFEKASVYNSDEYNANKTHFEDSTNLSFQQLDIEQLRKLVQPIANTL